MMSVVRWVLVRCGTVGLGLVRRGAVRQGREMERNKVYLTALEKQVADFLDMKGDSIYPSISSSAIDKRIIIEVDGKHWHSGKKKQKKDRFRDYMLKRAGWTVIRIKEEEIDKLDKLLSFLQL